MNDFDVDIAVMWVDGNDPAWLSEKKKYSAETDTVNRYRDWGLMKYWFRGIEKFAPWARRIHFITWGHVPECEEIHSPRVNIVNHRDFLPQKALPTYNSRGIELNIHRIPGIADRIVLFNDDMFLLKPTKKSDFFDKNGKPRMHYEEFPLRFKGHDANIRFQTILAGDIAVINRNFSKRDVSIPESIYRCRGMNLKSRVRSMVLKIFSPEYYTGFKISHGVGTYLKSTFEELWEAEPEKLNSTTMHRFRNPTDINRYALDWWQLAKGEFTPRTDDMIAYDITDEFIDVICGEIEGRKHTILCINDPDEDINFEDLKKRLNRSFSVLYRDS